MTGATGKTERVTDTIAAGQSASTAGQRKMTGRLTGMTGPGGTPSLTGIADIAAGVQSPETVGDQGLGTADGLHLGNAGGLHLESVKGHHQERARNSLTGHLRRAEGNAPDQGLRRKKKPS